MLINQDWLKLFVQLYQIEKGFAIWWVHHKAYQMISMPSTSRTTRRCLVTKIAKASGTKIIDQEELDAARSVMGDKKYRQEYEYVGGCN